MTTLTRKAPMKRTAFKPGAMKAATQGQKPAKAMRSRGMAGVTRTAAEKAHQSAVAELGCIACLFDGRRNPLVSVHHTDGRTKPGAHMKVLGLCGPHHQQDDTDPLGRIGVHPYKGRFEAKYGSQAQLLALTLRLLDNPASLRGFGGIPVIALPAA